MGKKWDGDATPAKKLLLLFTTLLFNRRAFSLTELSSPSCLNASKPTVLRLLEQLETGKIGMLIREKRGRESFYRLEHAKMSSLAVNPDGIAQLALCRDLVFHLLPENIQEETAQTLALLGSKSDKADSLSASCLVKGRIDYSAFQEIFSILEQAIRKRLVCRIGYHAVSNAVVRSHLFAPMRILASQDTVYIEGWLLEDPLRRKYTDPLRLALQRFRNCELTEFSSDCLPQLPFIKNAALGALENEAFIARIRFAPGVAAYISERIWSSGQKLETQDNGSVILTVRMGNFFEALAWVLGFGKKAVVLEPKWFAREVRRELREAARNYHKSKAEIVEETGESSA